MDKVARKVIAMGIPLLFVIGFINATYGADKLGTDPSIWPTILYYVKKVIAYGIPVMFVYGYIDATYGIYVGNHGIYEASPSEVADRLQIHPSVLRGIGRFHVIHIITWTTILVGVFLGNLDLVCYVTLFAFGMTVTDVIVSVPMWNLYPKPEVRTTAVSVVIFQLVYLLASGWLMAKG
jgi:hypothetical protein